jgi:chitinase
MFATLRGIPRARSGPVFHLVLLQALAPGCGGDGGGGAASRSVVDPPFLTLEDATVEEGNRERSLATFTVELSAPSAAQVTVEYMTRDGSARAGSDYRSASGVLQIPPGETTARIAVDVLGDEVDEGDEDFHLVLRNPQHAGLAREDVAGVIVDDDPRPSLAIGAVSAREGPANHSVLLAVELSPASGRPVTVEFETRDGTARAGSDYRAASGELSFAPGMTEEHVEVRIRDDSRHEPDETLRVVLRNPRNAAIRDGEALLTLTDDDARRPTRTPPRKPSKKKGGSGENGEEDGGEGEDDAGGDDGDDGGDDDD